MEKLDMLDVKILKIIQENSTFNTKEIAEQIGLSATPTYERIKRLEKLGVIAKYVALLDKSKIGRTLTVYCSVSLQVHSKPLLKNFELAMASLDEVMECSHIAGNFDYLLKVVAKDMQHYQDFLTNKLAGTENIAHVQSSFVMTEVKNTTAFKVEANC